jgi:hypothetical protein
VRFPLPQLLARPLLLARLAMRLHLLRCSGWSRVGLSRADEERAG